MSIHIVLDCADPEKLAEFWSKALGYEISGFADQWGMLKGPRDGDVFLLQRVPEPKNGKNRMHIDVTTSDIEAKTKELEELGARRLSDGTVSQFGMTWITMADPEGNEFCVCKE
ncbi:MAG TPA: VOC family protein [Actinomycetota bacterium]|nr:VOC family protein [Actinomycetota bacterium]